MATPKFSPQQCEAIADILVLSMCADGHFSLLEEDKIQEKLASLSWPEGFSLAHFVNLSIARARKAADSAELTKSYLDRCAAALGDDNAKKEAFEKAVSVLDSDGLKAEENQFLIQLRASLGV